MGSSIKVFKSNRLQLIRSVGRTWYDDAKFSILNAALYMSQVLQDWANNMVSETSFQQPLSCNPILTLIRLSLNKVVAIGSAIEFLHFMFCAFNMRACVRSLHFSPNGGNSPKLCGMFKVRFIFPQFFLQLKYHRDKLQPHHAPVQMIPDSVLDVEQVDSDVPVRILPSYVENKIMRPVKQDAQCFGRTFNCDIQFCFVWEYLVLHLLGKIDLKHSLNMIKIMAHPA